MDFERFKECTYMVKNNCNIETDSVHIFAIICIFKPTKDIKTT